jgi:hypothetical protein
LARDKTSMLPGRRNCRRHRKLQSSPCEKRGRRHVIPISGRFHAIGPQRNDCYRIQPTDRPPAGRIDANATHRRLDNGGCTVKPALEISTFLLPNVTIQCFSMSSDLRRICLVQLAFALLPFSVLYGKVPCRYNLLMLSRRGKTCLTVVERILSRPGDGSSVHPWHVGDTLSNGKLPSWNPPI